MAIDVGVYAPELDNGPQPAPLTCLRHLFDGISQRTNINVTHLYRSEPVEWDDSLYLPKVPGRCERVINQGEFDVVHFNSFVNLVNPKLLSMPSVIMYHGDVHWELPGVTGSRLGDKSRCALETVKLPQYNKILTVSSDLGGRVRDRYRLFNIDPITIYNGLDHSRFRPTGDGVPDSYKIKTPYLLHVSNYTQKKNPEGILEAFKRIHQQVDAKLLICGGGWKESDTVAQMIESMGIEQSVTLAGYVPDVDLPALYRNAAVFVYPSLHETFGLPIIEAMACGTPVVTADTYAPAEIAGEAAMTCDPNSPAEIADGIHSILKDPELATTLRERGLERSKTFTWKATADQLLDVYRTL